MESSVNQLLFNLTPKKIIIVSIVITTNVNILIDCWKLNLYIWAKLKISKAKCLLISNGMSGNPIKRPLLYLKLLKWLKKFTNNSNRIPKLMATLFSSQSIKISIYLPYIRITLDNLHQNVD